MIGEAVVLDLRPARLPSRALAFALDAAIMGLLGVIVLVVTSLVGADFDGALAAAVTIAVIVGILVGYPLLWETLTRGRSPGKYALGLRVVRDDGGPIRFRHALTRALTGVLLDFGVITAGTGIVAIVVSLCSAQGKRLGDLLAGTLVLRERVPRAATSAIPSVDPGLAAWATGLELSRVPDDLALTARQFLARAPELAPHVRVSMGERLAGDVAARVAPAPPPGVPPEPYLAAVLGERRRRETARLAASSSASSAPDARPWSASIPEQASGPPSVPGAPAGGQPASGQPAGRSPASGQPAGTPASGHPAGAPASGFAPPG